MKVVTVLTCNDETTEEEEEDGTITITIIIRIERAAACPTRVEEIEALAYLKVEGKIVRLVLPGTMLVTEIGEIEATMSVETQIIAVVLKKTTRQTTISTSHPIDTGRVAAVILVRAAIIAADTTTAVIAPTPVTVASVDSIIRHHRHHVIAKNFSRDPTATAVKVETTTNLDIRIEEADRRTAVAARVAKEEAAGREEMAKLAEVTEGLCATAENGAEVGGGVARPAVAANATVGVVAEKVGAGTEERDDIAQGAEQEVEVKNAARAHLLLLSREGGTEEEEGVAIADVAAARSGEETVQEATIVAFAVGDVILGVTAAHLRLVFTKRKNHSTASRCLPVVLASGTIVMAMITVIIDAHRHDTANLAQANDITLDPTMMRNMAPLDTRALEVATTITTIHGIKNAVEEIMTLQITLRTASATLVEIAAIKRIKVVVKRTPLDGK